VICKKSDVQHEKTRKGERSVDVTFREKSEISSKKTKNVLATEGANVV
jgi:hypothetical protein